MLSNDTFSSSSANTILEMGIYNWVIRFSREAIDRVKDFQPVVRDTWIADETVLKVGGRNIWFFDVIDEKTRYLLASRLAHKQDNQRGSLSNERS
jgi:transposase-like protein